MGSKRFNLKFGPNVVDSPLWPSSVEIRRSSRRDRFRFGRARSESRLASPHRHARRGRKPETRRFPKEIKWEHACVFRGFEVWVFFTTSSENRRPSPTWLHAPYGLFARSSRKLVSPAWRTEADLAMALLGIPFHDKHGSPRFREPPYTRENHERVGVLNSIKLARPPDDMYCSQSVWSTRPPWSHQSSLLVFRPNPEVSGSPRGGGGARCLQPGAEAAAAPDEDGDSSEGEGTDSQEPRARARAAPAGARGGGAPRLWRTARARQADANVQVGECSSAARRRRTVRHTSRLQSHGVFCSGVS